jgi:hypothetical protein
MEVDRIHKSLMARAASGDPSAEIPKPDLEGWDDEEEEGGEKEGSVGQNPPDASTVGP